MKHSFFYRCLFASFFLGCLILAANGQPSTLAKAYDLSRPKSRAVQRFTMTSVLVNYAPDGAIKDSDVYRLSLTCKPGTATGDTFVCEWFTVQFSGTPAVAIPALAGFKYVAAQTASGTDESGPLFGIAQEPFEKLVDSNGKNIPFDKAYHVYNAFIDFHSMSVFADKTATGKGVQDLKHIGEQVVHAASFSQPQVQIGMQVKKGSVFRNGEITLTFKGLSLVNGRACALLGYDSGQSTFTMVMAPFPSVEVRTVGCSHYHGDISKDLNTGWIQRADLSEMVVAETDVPGQAQKIHSVIERSIRIFNVPL